MTVRGASLPGSEPPGQDRWAASEHGVIVLDGATAFNPAAPPADRYVDALLTALTDTLGSPSSLQAILRDTISSVARQLCLTPDARPSSTVLLLREQSEHFQLAALGDSTALVGFQDGSTERVTDERITRIAPDQHAHYRDRLLAGHGYDSTHHDLLQQIQRAEQAARNTKDSYWIAETDPAAGHHAILRQYPRNQVAWCVLTTDGAQRGYDHHGVDRTTLHKATADELHGQLTELQRWEAESDPDGRQLPRAKRHDDKTVVTWSAG